jgi:O-6-methylguanine DNA methyltransferase
MAHSARYSFPIGSVTVGYEDDAVVSLKISPSAGVSDNPSLFSDQVAMELQEYFQGKRTRFTFPLRLDGTDFQKAVWQELLRIPYGQTRTYGQVASAIGRPKASRAVGIACSKNPIWIAVPCHRVIGKNNALTGYAGGLDLKQKLLDLETSK